MTEEKGKKIRVIYPDDPDFKALMAAGKVVSGADSTAQLHQLEEDEPILTVPAKDKKK